LVRVFDLREDVAHISARAATETLEAFFSEETEERVHA
jgi:hypothetical protein